MQYNTTITTVLLILTTVITNSGLGEDKKPVETKLSVYPETVAFGDTCYVLVTAINHSGRATRVTVPNFDASPFSPDLVQFDLTHRGRMWRGLFEREFSKSDERATIYAFPIPDGEVVTFLATPLQFPPIEDLYQDDFWTKMRQELKENPEGFPLDFGIEFVTPGEFFRRDRLTQKVTIKLRNEEEMGLIDSWYHSTPSGGFPSFVEVSSGLPPNRQIYLSKITPRDQNLCRTDGKIILGRSSWAFVNTGNRFPGGPNIPETWQGWKELEESLTPSTMQDEIRLTRIMIQYCATVDNAVLKELKDWFDDMNEIQRTVMAKSLRDRAIGPYGIYRPSPPFWEIYQTIREYDIVPFTTRCEKHLRDIGLIE